MGDICWPRGVTSTHRNMHRQEQDRRFVPAWDLQSQKSLHQEDMWPRLLLSVLFSKMLLGCMCFCFLEPCREKWACRQSRPGAPGKKLSSCISLTDRRPPRRWHRDHGSGGPKRQRYVSFTNPSTTRPGQVGRRARRQAGAKGKKDKSQARASEQAGAKAKAQDPKGPQTQKSPKPKSKPPTSPPLKKQVSENLKPKSPPKRQKHRLQNPPNL